jgi:phosphatidylinositol N-acetylglucosaminyltransferase subunit Y
MGIITHITGYFLLFSSFVWFTVLIIWTIGAKLLQKQEENSFLRLMQEDYYYCYLIPMTIPTTFILVYANWVSMKFFRHN